MIRSLNGYFDPFDGLLDEDLTFDSFAASFHLVHVNVVIEVTFFFEVVFVFKFIIVIIFVLS
jgi:hypothetical protein